ncbi:hypothetical protein SPONN_646 [uncultured Candidatus Thioglobus sp.]|nr:hypothetical protein SPONN_646 [uncultured Candidatus Thioglobus sp.]
MTLYEYEKKVIECIVDPACTEVILNNDIYHATILIEQMFKHATQKVKLLSVSLDSRLYSQKNVLDAMRGFLQKQYTSLDIVTEQEICPESNVALLKILDKFKTKISAKIAEPWLSEQYEYNFLVADESTYRFEGDKNKHEATVEFHNKEYTLKLNNVFDKIYKLAQ